MKRHVAAVMVVVCTGLVIDSHVDWVRQDDSALLVVSGQTFDLLGWGREQYRQVFTSCQWVSNLPVNSPMADAILQAIRQHSLPDSRSARLVRLQQLDEWGVAEVVFDTLNPSLVLVHHEQGHWRVLDRATWSGSTGPWHPADTVRRYLQRQAPQLPVTLRHCLVVDPIRFGRVPGGLALSGAERADAGRAP